MLFVKHDCKNPYRNHAVEELLMNKFNEDCFMLWENEKCILLGRNQNAYSEINMDYALEHNIAIVRRITGGGAVFNDKGNFNFTFISCNTKGDFADFGKFVIPIREALKKLGVNAELSGRNDLTIEGKKFSGNAQCRYKDKVLHHGTLLFSANVSDITNALNVKDIKLKGKGIKSVKSRVTNISDHIDFSMSAEEFREFLFNEVYNNTKNARMYTITDEDWREIDSIAQDKYFRWEWNFGSSPRFNIEREGKFQGGIVQASLEVKKGIIENIRIYGDFFSEKDVTVVEDLLKGVSYSYQQVYAALRDINMDEYLKNITLENFMELLF